MNIGNENISKIYAGSTEISKAYLGSEQVYGGEPKYEEIPLTIEVTRSASDASKGKVNFPSVKSAHTQVEISINGGEWVSITSLDSGSSGYYVNVSKGDKLQFRNNGNTTGWSGVRFINVATGDTSIAYIAYGNFLSLQHYDDFATITAQTTSFKDFFKGEKNLIDAKNVVLAALTIGTWQFWSTFEGTSISEVPRIFNATNAPQRAFTNMFASCQNLVSVPLDYFKNLTSFGNDCMGGMFQKCSSLVQAPNLPESSTVYMFGNMFQDCTSLTKAPDLTAQIIPKNWAYREMFKGCTSLNYIKCLATGGGLLEDGNVTENWVNGVASTGTFVKAAGADWSGKTGNNGIPSGWTVIEE